MRFFSLWPFFFLLLIPPVIMLYFLKQKPEEKEVSSLYLWDKVYKSKEVNTPWEKFKKSLLLFLQLLALLALIFALTDPFINLRGKDYQNVILILDNTGSMGAAYSKDTTRFEEGKKRAEKFINSLRTGSRISIIICGNTPKVEVSGTSDKAEALMKLKNIEPVDLAGDINESVSLVKSMAKQYESYRAVFYTDENMDLKDLNAELVNLSSNGENVSLDYISHSKEKSGLKVIVRATNRSDKDLTREICIYGDERILSVKKLDIKAGETKTVYFEDIALKGEHLRAQLTEKDDLMNDNIAYDVIKQGETQKVLLVSQKNIFIEKALGTVNNVELFKASSVEGIKMSDKYNLYIFDGMVPTILPSDGSILFINPPDNSLFQVNSTVEGGLGEVLEHTTTKYVTEAVFNVEKQRDIVLPNWAKSIMKVNDKEAGFVGEYKNRKFAAIGFDLHKTDLVLNAEFPILMHNLSSYLVDTGLMTKTDYLCGDNVEINALPDGGDLIVDTAFELKETIPLRYPLKNFSSTYKPGIYKVTQKFGDVEKSNIFAVNFPTDKESNINFEGKSESTVKKSDLNKMAGIVLQPFLIMALIAILALEWVAYVKRY
ncbi:BatA and WFA domain-containing protein [Clostridium swellfunianum]|uniref:vWA domain-containing protein n=1 Tax=Clostridium swellfunianum TaxID=1367462 RepID=UPI00202DCD11|nr:BatA and WFA domain-containing protein [Clostridium swellfunianum]MCM0650296.1 BatA and WFA domain-containing protein [Clostridium swellfunianum]